MDAKDRVAADIEPIGNCLHETKPSFVKLEIYRMPENLLHAMDGKSPVIAPCDPNAYHNAVKVVMHKALRGHLPRVF